MIGAGGLEWSIATLFPFAAYLVMGAVITFIFSLAAAIALRAR